MSEERLGRSGTRGVRKSAACSWFRPPDGRLPRSAGASGAGKPRKVQLHAADPPHLLSTLSCRPDCKG
eukprot:8578562-Pyramimonas_sp.AAC.1